MNQSTALSEPLRSILIKQVELEKAHEEMNVKFSELTALVRQAAREDSTISIYLGLHQYVNNIKSMIADVYGISISQLETKGRERPAPDARKIFYWLMHKKTNVTTTQIGVLMNQSDPYDHSTVIYGRDKVDSEVSLYVKHGIQTDLNTAALMLEKKVPKFNSKALDL